MIKPDPNIEELVVFSGGGAGGVGQWESFKYWRNLGFEGDMFAGTSAGTINATFASRGLYDLADDYYRRTYDGTAATVFGPELAELKDGKLTVSAESIRNTVLKGINVWDVPKLITKKGQKKLIQQIGSNVMGVQSLINNKPLLQSLKEVLQAPHTQELPLLFNVVNMITGGLERHEASKFPDLDMLALALLASTNIPVILPLVPGYSDSEASYKQLADGGLRDGSPVAQMLKRLDPKKSQRITVFNINKRQISTAEELNSAAIVAGRTIQILLNQILISNLEVVLERNKIAKMYGEREGYRYVPIVIIEASHDRGVFDFSAESLEEQVRTAPADVERALISEIF